MAELATAPAAEAPSASTPGAAPAPAAATPQAGTPAPGSAGSDDRFVTVPKEKLGRFNGQWDEPLRFVNALERHYGADYKAILAALENPQPLADPPPATPSEPAAPADEPLTLEAIQKLLDERDTKSRQAQEQERTQQEWAAKATTARQDRDSWHVEAGKTLFPPDKDGKQPPIAGKVSAMLERELIGVMVDSMPEWQRTHKDAQRYLDIAVNYTKPTAEQKAKALKAMQDVLADFTTTARSQFASGQADTPTTTLSGGAGGRQTPKPQSEMTKAERIEAIRSRL